MFEGINLTDVSGWVVAGGVCVLVVVALVKGWLVTGNIARMWFEAWQTDRHTVEKMADMMDDLALGQKTITTFIGEIKEAGATANPDHQERAP